MECVADYTRLSHDKCIVAYRTIDSEHSHEEEHMAAEKLLSDVLLAELGEDISNFQVAKGAHGKPYFVGSHIYFNISHCRGLVACVVANSTEELSVGIDAENIRAYRANVAERIFSDGEIVALNEAQNKDEFFFQVWTFKESIVKMSGAGLSWDAKDIDYLNNDYETCQYRVQAGGEDYIIAVAVGKEMSI